MMLSSGVTNRHSVNEMRSLGMIYSIIIILVALEKSNVVIYVQYVMDISLQLGLGSTVIKKN